ncbi:hypothetical protein ACRRS0_05420 [Agarivorans sp. QJM3NY_29]|uniref:hypothetical protein n=1 Tax=unclassified Agarivorans TaxID=2636026 RepID=UPI003D7DA7A4
MFSLKVDNDIKLSLVQKSFAPIYAQLAQENLPYLEQWLVWPPHCKTEQDFASFIQKSLHDYADGKSMVCGVFYNEILVGNVSFNTINHELKKSTLVIGL